MAAAIDVADVQSLVFSGHGRLPATLALGFSIRDRQAATPLLREAMARHLSCGFGDKSHGHAVQLLLSAAGVAALSGGDALTGLGRPFQQGMITVQRSRALGDAHRSDPSGWAWSDREFHILLLVYARDGAELRATAEQLDADLGPGWTPVFSFPFELPADGREPFGFLDGLSIARVDAGEGTPEKPGVTLVPPGEVVLGARNAAGITPAVAPLAENGSYVVLRQLEQDVQAFWNFWRGQSRDEEEAVWLAAKAVGRWPNGMPVSGSAPMPEPAFDEAQALAPLRFADDARELKCPFGAHVRRANPRDGLGDDPSASLEAVQQHRLVRRGRVYGPAAPAAWYPEIVRRAKQTGDDATPGGSRGLMFIALCADIARQFEFIQQTWLNNPKFSDLYDEVDPIAAGHGIPADSHRFSIPRAPLRFRVSGVQRWVTVRGGGYFLLPGRRALLRFLSGM